LLIRQVKFANFRNLDLTFDPSSGFNVIYGANGKGKSNFLDGLSMISSGKSFKRFNNADNINFNEDIDFARVEALVEANGVAKLATVFTKITDNKYQHKYFLNEKATLKSKFEYIVKTILFTPESLELLIGSPEDRRDELDDLICIFDKDYAGVLRQYSYVVRSRNRLLQKINSGKASREQLSYWSDRLISIGSEIVLSRQKYLNQIEPSLEITTKNLFGDFKDSKLSLKYLTSLRVDPNKIKDDFKQKLEDSFSKEVLLGRTLYGPHRDDLEFRLNSRNLHVFGSRGEQRLATMIFKISAYDYLTDLYKTKVIFLLDDILSELDKKNKAKLVDYIRTTQAQVFFSLANKDDLPKSIIQEGKILEL